LADAIKEGSEIAKVRQAELAASSEQMSKENDGRGENGPKVKSRMRGRKNKNDDMSDDANNAEPQAADSMED
jgi:hypothetical protein